MNPLDFANSYMTFTIKDRSNTARIQLDARCVVTDRTTGRTEEVVLITPCRSERMYLKEKLFQDPNYEFSGIWSAREFVLIRTHPDHDPRRGSEWDPGDNASRFASVRIDLRTFPEAQALTTDEQVVRATLKNLALVARTHVRHTDPHLSAVLEYPVKTMNVCEGTKRFQVDTGPLLLPDFASRAKRPAERFALAFICFNTFDAAEFVVRQPTPSRTGGKEVAQVMHYGRIVRMPATHELFCAGKL
jgi:hypothetical protein